MALVMEMYHELKLRLHFQNNYAATAVSQSFKSQISEACKGHPQRPRDFRRAEGNLEVGGDVQTNSSRFDLVYGNSLIIYPFLGIYHEIHPFRASSIDSVEINTSLLMSRECYILNGFSDAVKQTYYYVC